MAVQITDAEHALISATARLSLLSDLFDVQGHSCNSIRPSTLFHNRRDALELASKFYNRVGLRSTLLPSLALILTLATLAGGQAPVAVPRTVLVVPFENLSKAPGIEWIGESFPEVLSQRMAVPGWIVGSREERQRAFDRAGLPADLHPSRATLYRIAEQLDKDYVVLGTYNFDGQKFTTTARLLDIKRARLSAELQHEGPLPQLVAVQTELAWELLRQLDSAFPVSRETFVASAAPIRLDALENYVRGVLATKRSAFAKLFASIPTTRKQRSAWRKRPSHNGNTARPPPPASRFLRDMN
jgi:TolB-like protein